MWLRFRKIGVGVGGGVGVGVGVGGGKKNEKTGAVDRAYRPVGFYVCVVLLGSQRGFFAGLGFDRGFFCAGGQVGAECDVGSN